MLKTKVINASTILLIPVWVLFAYLAVPLISGIELISPVRTLILSSKSALFFFNILAIAMVGGYIASKYRSNKPLYIGIQATTFSMVILIAWITSKIQHSHGWG